MTIIEDENNNVDWPAYYWETEERLKSLKKTIDALSKLYVKNTKNTTEKYKEIAEHLDRLQTAIIETRADMQSKENDLDERITYLEDPDRNIPEIKRLKEIGDRIDTIVGSINYITANLWDTNNKLLDRIIALEEK